MERRRLAVGAVVVAGVAAIVVVASDEERPCVNRSEDVVEAPAGGSARDALAAYMRDNPTSLVGRQDLDDLDGSAGHEASETFHWDDDHVFATATRSNMAATSWYVRQVGRDCSADPINP